MKKTGEEIRKSVLNRIPEIEDAYGVSIQLPQERGRADVRQSLFNYKEESDIEENIFELICVIIRAEIIFDVSDSGNKLKPEGDSPLHIKEPIDEIRKSGAGRLVGSVDGDWNEADRKIVLYMDPDKKGEISIWLNVDDADEDGLCRYIISKGGVNIPDTHTYRIEQIKEKH